VTGAVPEPESLAALLVAMTILGVSPRSRGRTRQSSGFIGEARSLATPATNGLNVHSLSRFGSLWILAVFPMIRRVQSGHLAGHGRRCSYPIHQRRRKVPIWT
jgi:hypothetical protein